MADQNLTPEEYQTWYPPLRALQLLGGETVINRTRIAHRMQDGVLRTVAKMLILPRGQQASFVFLPKIIWQRWGFLADPGFWRVGDTTLYPESSSGYRLSEFEGARVYQARLDPAVIDELVADDAAAKSVGAIAAEEAARATAEWGARLLGPPAAEPTRRRAAPVSNAEVADWHARLPADEQYAGYRRLWPKAKAALGEGVVRKQLEPFSKGQRTGPKGRNG